MAAQMNDNRSATLKEALQRFVEAYLQGRQPDIGEFVKQYPEYEAQLKKRIKDLREIDTLFDSIFQADGISIALLPSRVYRLNYRLIQMLGFVSGVRPNYWPR